MTDRATSSVFVGTVLQVHPRATVRSNDGPPQMTGRLMGAHEVAQRLGVSRQRVQQLINRPDWPEPYDRLAMGKVWLTADVEALISRHRPPAPRADPERQQRLRAATEAATRRRAAKAAARRDTADRRRQGLNLRYALRQSRLDARAAQEE